MPSHNVISFTTMAVKLGKLGPSTKRGTLVSALVYRYSSTGANE